ncbi:MAG TPA: hypothetical protein VKU19_14810 [Bryobacteraceae bacterium]|nr:hypothetical protein [Bryobacteraceae bacterium]
MRDAPIEMAAAIGPDGEMIFCAVDYWPPATSPPATNPLLNLLVIAVSGLVTLALTARLK